MAIGLLLLRLGCRIEQIHLNRKDGIAKVVGTIASVAGASVITLYKGPTIYAPNSSHLHQSHFLVSLGDAKGKNWTLGCIYLIVHCLCWSGWIVVQAPLLKKYPARLSVTSYSCLFSTLQFLVIAASFERDLQAWQVHSDGELFSIFYTVSESENQIFLHFQGKHYFISLSYKSISYFNSGSSQAS